jgi:hypothetical protein
MLKLFLQIILGFGVGLYGYLIPSYISLSVFQASMKVSPKALRKILFIIALVEIPYCFVCMNSMQWLMTQNMFLLIIKWLISVLLFVMGIFTFIHANKAPQHFHEAIKKSNLADTRRLLIYAIFNPFQFSAWAIWGTYFIEKTWFDWTYFSIFIFSIGASIGVYVILYLYALMGQKLIQYFSTNQQKIHIGIATLMILLAVIQCFRNLN